jgi:hypothetical protein
MTLDRDVDIQALVRHFHDEGVILKSDGGYLMFRVWQKAAGDDWKAAGDNWADRLRPHKRDIIDHLAEVKAENQASWLAGFEEAIWAVLQYRKQLEPFFDSDTALITLLNTLINNMQQQFIHEGRPQNG